MVDQALLDNGIAIVGLAARLPGASNVDEFWHNLRNGVESLEPIPEEDLLARGVSPRTLKDPNYVPVSGSLPEVEMFDAGYFGLSPKDAAITDPQHRHFLECAVEAFEVAGHSTHRFDGAIGVFAGCGMNSYFLNNLMTNPEMVRTVGSFLLRHTGNDRDFLPTTVSYKLNLTGPSMAIQTACSTSLVAIHVACQSLLAGECDMAVAGGSTILVPNGEGYTYRENEPVSPDGHCRAFDADSAGTVLTSGTGVVVVRRLEDALEDGDTIHAVIRGSAVNNDGAGKVGYMAPSVEGHASAVAEALAVADIPAETVSYLEAHGTGTHVGDPIEISALTQAFRASTDRSQFCRIGSVKTNIGHLDTAAGVASLIKVVRSMQARELAPTLNFKKPNPEIDFENSPFIVNAELRPWETDGVPRRAGVSSLGIGGTNAHVVLEEAPAPMSTDAPRHEQQLLTLSAKSKSALDNAATNLASWLEANPQADLADVAFTLQEGRDYWEHRLVLSAADVAQAQNKLADRDALFCHTSKAERKTENVAFMFSGAGSQYANMGRDLYQHDEVFRQAIEDCFTHLDDLLDYDLRSIIYPEAGKEDEAEQQLLLPSRLCPAVVIVEWALAKLWQSRGIEPVGVIGHSLGEYVAACMAGVFSLKDMLKLVVLRGRLIERLSGGAMLSLAMDEAQARELIGDDLDLAAVNSPGLCVASGMRTDVEALQQRLADMDIETRLVPVDAAGHSRHLDSILDEFLAGVQQVQLSAPQLPYVSNVTGTWATADDVAKPEYWVQHLRGTVRFSQGIETLLSREDCVLLEVGPGQTLCTFARQQAERPLGIVPSLRRSGDDIDDQLFTLQAFGRLWASGYEVDWQNLRSEEERRQRIPLPTYPFEHKPYWIEPGEISDHQAQEEVELDRYEDFSSWFRQPQWSPQPVSISEESLGGNWLVFVDGSGVGQALVEQLRSVGCHVSTVAPADTFVDLGEDRYALAPELGRAGYEQLVGALTDKERLPDQVVHLWSLTLDETFRPGSSFLDRTQESGFYSLLYLMQSLSDADKLPQRIDVVSNGLFAVDGNDYPAHPEKTTLMGPVRVIPREFPETECRCIDITLPITQSTGLKAWVGLEGPYVEEQAANAIASDLLAEVGSVDQAVSVALRGNGRFVETMQKAARGTDEGVSFRTGGTYLITGGMGGVGFALAQQIVAEFKANVVLLGRSAFPAEQTWDAWLESHGERDATARKIRAIRDMRAAGGDVMVASADITDREAMQNVLAGVSERFGALHGVLHAAAAVSDGLLQTKSKDAVEQTFASKVYGTLVLNELLADHDLDFLLLFSSTSAVVGLPGQIDYAGANAFLNAFAEKRSSAGKPTYAVDWGIWHDVGGALDLASQMKGEASQITYERQAGHELLGVCTQESDGEWVWQAEWQADSLWVLNEHRNQDGIALLPGTGFLELGKAAIADALGEASCFIQDVAFLSPLVVDEEHPLAVRMELSRAGDNRLTFRVLSGADDVEHCTMTLSSLSAVPDPLDVDALKQQFAGSWRAAEAGQTLASSQEAQLGFGPRWSCLQGIGYDEQAACAHLAVNETFAQDFDQYHLHPGLLDIATSFGIPLIEGWQSGTSIYVPLAYGEVKAFGNLEREVVTLINSHADNAASRDVATFDITIAATDGRVLLDVRNYQMRKLDKDAGFASPAKNESSGSRHEPSAMEALFLETFEHGIRLDEGYAALKDTLKAYGPGVTVVSPINTVDWSKRIEHACAQTSESVGVTFARPDLDSEYEAPRNDLERELVKIWQEFLGVDEIGIHDDFFDLGGHSLIAVRVFAKLKKQWGVDWPISKLFDAPCISQFSELLQVEVGDVAKGDSEEAAEQPENHRFLVKLNRSSNKSRTPLFLVAGMFGNVLNLRHLAMRLGDDQPVYALQAKGLYGEDEPHFNFVDAARDYIAEMRSVQPEGPYMIGGFSGGGVTAFEIAHQLLAVGEEISALVMLDSIPPHPAWPLATSSDKLKIQWQRLRTEVFKSPVDWIKGRIRWEFEKRMETNATQEQTPAEFRSDLIEAAFRTSLACYEMKVLPVKLSLFRPPLDDTFKLGNGRCANVDGLLMEDRNWWSPWTSEGIDVHLVPGDHDSMVLEPNVKVLADAVRATLDAAQPGSAEVMQLPGQNPSEESSENTHQGVRYAS